MPETNQTVMRQGRRDRGGRGRARTLRLEILLTPEEARQIQGEAARRGLPAGTYARMALLGGFDHAQDAFERAIERMEQVVRRHVEGVVAAVAAAATIVIGKVSNQRPPADELSKAVDALIAYYRARITNGTQAEGGGEDGTRVG